MSNDLISRSELLNQLKKIKAFGELTAKKAIRIVEEQPTAYNTDKVIEEIKELRSNPDLYVYGVDAYTNAIGIVRKGGVE